MRCSSKRFVFTCGTVPSCSKICSFLSASPAYDVLQNKCWLPMSRNVCESFRFFQFLLTHSVWCAHVVHMLQVSNQGTPTAWKWMFSTLLIFFFFFVRVVIKQAENNYMALPRKGKIWNTLFKSKVYSLPELSVLTGRSPPVTAVKAGERFPHGLSVLGTATWAMQGFELASCSARMLHPSICSSM